MKKKLILLFAVLITAAIASSVNLVYAGRIQNAVHGVDGGGGGAYTNSCPGKQGERQSQAVWCAGGGWKIVAGCANGGGKCDNMNPCNGEKFRVGRSGWCDPVK